MENKYYTPDIEEFHIGFEYERQDYEDENIWHKEVLSFEWGWLEIPKDFNENKRVKFLDKEDIESLGWKYEKTHAGMTESFYSKNTNEEKYDYLGMDYDTENNYLRIYYSECEGDSTLFQGTIKNKSELKKLMKQLNIN